MFSEDLGTFYDGSEFATEFTLVASAPEVSFAAIVSEVDEEALQGYVVGSVRELRWPTAAATLPEGQLISAAAGPWAGTWRVLRDGRKVVDGAESVTYITTTT